MPKIYLEPLQTSHIEHIMRWVNDPEVMAYFAGHQNAITVEQEKTYIEQITASRNDRVWSVFDAETGMYVGQCSINQIYWPAANGRIFLVVRKEMQGQGYAPAILEALKREAFGRLALHKLWLIVREDNKSAQLKYVKAGFEIEGLLRDEYFVKGKYHNMVRMGLVNTGFSWPKP